MKVIKKVLFWVITMALVMFLGILSMATASRMHVGQNFGQALIGGWEDTADGIGELLGVPGTTVKPDIEFDFKNGEVSFGNTHISW